MTFVLANKVYAVVSGMKKGIQPGFHSLIHIFSKFKIVMERAEIWNLTDFVESKVYIYKQVV